MTENEEGQRGWLAVLAQAIAEEIGQRLAIASPLPPHACCAARRWALSWCANGRWRIGRG
jgi:hypothetical protein